jgi:hypothetical protein
VTWTVADGSRGRRWREAVSDGTGIRHSLLLETDPDRRFAHLELATPAGLLTLHPEGDGTLHGNAVEVGGIRHVVAVPWDRDGTVDLAGSAVTRAAAAWLLDGAAGATQRDGATVLGIDARLVLDVRTAVVSRRREGSWAVDGGPAFTADREGLPVLEDATMWPLERDG